MSEVEFHVGKAKEVCKDQPTFEDKVNQLCIELNTTPDSLVEDWGDDYQQMKYRGDYVYVKSTNQMFQLLNDKNIEEDGELIEATWDDETSDTFSYKLRWYNGGASFDEVFEDALKQLDNAE